MVLVMVVEGYLIGRKLSALAASVIPPTAPPASR